MNTRFKFCELTASHAQTSRNTHNAVTYTYMWPVFHSSIRTSGRKYETRVNYEWEYKNILWKPALQSPINYRFNAEFAAIPHFSYITILSTQYLHRHEYCAFELTTVLYRTWWLCYQFLITYVCVYYFSDDLITHSAINIHYDHSSRKYSYKFSEIVWNKWNISLYLSYFTFRFIQYVPRSFNLVL